MVNKCHFIGIGGIGMSGLARLLLQKNIEVSGSDLVENYVTKSLVEAGATIHIGHSVNHIRPEMTVIYTTGINENNPEFLAAQKLNCRLWHRSDMLFHLMEGCKTLAVAGTHGKTTTSSLLAWVLETAKWDPTFAIGGIIPQFQVNAKRGSSEYFVAEACESDGTFLKYQPYGAIITNVDFDHMDFYKTRTALLEAFKLFSETVKHKEHLIWCGDDEKLVDMQLQGVSYGFNQRCELQISNYKQRTWQAVFDLKYRGIHYREIVLNLVGRHNVLNAAAVFGLAVNLGVEEKYLREAFYNFQGVKRRCQHISEVYDVQIIDDYAHHPTEIKATLEGVREAVRERRIIAVFQPHRYTRTRDCLEDFGKCFTEADEVIITDIWHANEEHIEGITPQRVVEEVALSSCANAQYVPKTDLEDVLHALVRPHDVVLTLGAGDITKLSGSLTNSLNEKPPKKYRVGIVFGGRSSEHEVSLISSKNVIASLDRDCYEMELFGIQKNGSWVAGDDSFERLGQNLYQVPISTEVFERIFACDIFFPVLHGPYGEDGRIQGFFEIINKAYVGCDHRSAAICMDKAQTKRIASLFGLPVVPFVSFSKNEWKLHRNSLCEKIKDELIFPVFVKPLHLGSSVGVKKVEEMNTLSEALHEVFKVDNDALVENGLNVREIEFAVYGNDRIETYPPGEILAAGCVFDYDGKYGSNATPVQDEADLPNALVEEGMNLAKRAYAAMGCKGMARVDLFLDEKQHYWLNEINPIPGFTSMSLYPRICARNGMDNKALIRQLIILGLERKRSAVRY